MTVYLVVRIVSFPGGSVSWVLKAFDEERLAKEKCDADNKILRELDAANLVFRVADSFVPAGMDLGTFLAGLGLVGVEHRVVTMDAAGAIIKPPVGLVVPS